MQAVATAFLMPEGTDTPSITNSSNSVSYISAIPRDGTAWIFLAGMTDNHALYC